jgi:hypothetical protein
MAYNRDKTLEAVKSHAQGHIDKHKINVEILLERPAGIGEHGDLLTEIEKELKIIAEYQDKLDVVEQHFETKDPFKAQA